jgi:hypothetical protein
MDASALTVSARNIKYLLVTYVDAPDEAAASS